MATESTRNHDVPHGCTEPRHSAHPAWPVAIAGSIALSVLGACAPKMDPATARAQFSSKARSMEGAVSVAPAQVDGDDASNSSGTSAAAAADATTTPAATASTATVTGGAPAAVGAATGTVSPATPRGAPAIDASSKVQASAQAAASDSAADPAADPAAILRTAARDQWAALRAHAVEASIRNPKLLADPSLSVQAAAMLALHRAGQRINFTPLAAMIENNDPEVRANAYLVLGEIGNDSAIPLIRQSIGRGMKLVNPLRVRLVDLAAAEALVKLGDEFEAEPIRAALFAPPEQGELTVVACDSVRRLRDEVARPMLERIVSASGSSMRSPEIRLAACRALVRLGAGPAPLLIAREYAAHPDARVRAQAAALLGEIGTPEALQMLVGMLADASTSVQVAAAGGLEAAE